MFLTLRPPPIEYSADYYTPERVALAPGDTLIYTPTLTIAHGGYLKVVRGYWNIDQNQAATDCEGKIVPPIVMERSVPPLVAGVVRGNIVKLVIPALPPGHYWLSSTAMGPTGGTASYLVGFSVVKPCNG